jgi:hypothetical protein
VAVGDGTLSASLEGDGVIVEVGPGIVAVATLVFGIAVFVASGSVGVEEMISVGIAISGSSLLVRLIAVGTVTESSSERSEKTPQEAANVTVKQSKQAVVIRCRCIMIHPLQIGIPDIAYKVFDNS